MSESLRKGDLGEIAVMKDLMTRGCKICIPYGSDWRFDLLVFSGKHYQRIQVKTALLDENKGSRRYVVRSFSTGHVDKERREIRYTKDEVDWIAAFIQETGDVFYIRIEEFSGKGTLYFRYDTNGIKEKANRDRVKLIGEYREFPL